MRQSTGILVLLCALVSITATATPLPSQNPEGAADLVRVTVTAVGRHGEPPAEVAREDVIVFQDSDHRPVVEWVPAQGEHAGLDLVILMEDSLDPSVGGHLRELAEFIRSLPPTARVGVAYARNGIATFTQEFTSDHEQAAKALRIPLGGGGAFSSPYLSLIDLFQRWPETANRRQVLFVSHGIDLFRGVAESAPGLNLDLERATHEAQKGGIVVHTLFASGVGRAFRNPYLIGNGQGCLLQLAYETGGEAFFQGSQTPLDFKPYLDEVKTLLGQQYLLTFRAQLGEKAGYEHLRVTTEVPGVELVAPEHVYIPAAK